MNKLHVALLITHTDITIEADLHQSLAPSYVIHAQRMWLDNVEEEAEKRMVDIEFPKALQYLEGITDFNSAVFGCTSASAVYGKSGLRRIENTLEEKLKCRSVSAFGAVLRAIEKNNAKQIALVTPYVESVNTFMMKSLCDFHVNVVFSYGMGLLNDRQIVSVNPEKIVEHVRQEKNNIADSGADLCLISCTALRAMEIRSQLEGVLQIPVITSNQCIYDFIVGEL